MSAKVAVLNGSLYFSETIICLSSTDALTPITYRNIVSLRICCPVSDLVEICQQIQRLQRQGRTRLTESRTDSSVAKAISFGEQERRSNTEVESMLFLAYFNLKRVWKFDRER